ncbi:hypothetical protein TNCV_852881 [Trichonephila clavipes]|nr:hypothetical protein TNCV_852881 [Trichonephila clavipes]
MHIPTGQLNRCNPKQVSVVPAYQSQNTLYCYDRAVEEVLENQKDKRKGVKNDNERVKLSNESAPYTAGCWAVRRAAIHESSPIVLGVSSPVFFGLSANC